MTSFNLDEQRSQTNENTTECHIPVNFMEIIKNGTKIGVANLRSFGKSVLTFGSSPLNDIVIPSSAVSQRQGLILIAGNDIEIRDNPDSDRNLYFDGKTFLTKIVRPNTEISIKPEGKAAEEILLTFNE